MTDSSFDKVLYGLAWSTFVRDLWILARTLTPSPVSPTSSRWHSRSSSAFFIATSARNGLAELVSSNFGLPFGFLTWKMQWRLYSCFLLGQLFGTDLCSEDGQACKARETVPLRELAIDEPKASGSMNVGLKFPKTALLNREICCFELREKYIRKKQSNFVVKIVFF